MNITRLNYPQVLPVVKSAIEKAHFLAFDLEMSGLMTEELTSPSILDSVPPQSLDAAALPQAKAVSAQIHPSAVRTFGLRSAPLGEQVTPPHPGSLPTPSTSTSSP